MAVRRIPYLGTNFEHSTHIVGHKRLPPFTAMMINSDPFRSTTHSELRDWPVRHPANMGEPSLKLKPTTPILEPG